MCENTKPDLTGKVRFQRGRNEDRNTGEIYENTYVEESTPSKLQDTTEDRWQGNISSRKWPLVLLVLLCFLLLAAVMVLVVLLIQDKCLNANLSREKEKLYSEMQTLSANLTQKIDELQMKLETAYCPDEWRSYGSSCYLISTTAENWKNGKQSCESLNGHLVIINSREEQKFISSLGLEAWIGLKDQERGSFWKWDDGSVVNTMYWGNGELQDYLSSEKCALISNFYPSSNNWKVLPCTYQLKFICEIGMK
ncbi:CD209 antigen-like protein C [Anabas testudineus]|uniref:C-type lectin domain-containing protein n=1 Tax=Anabas testudineus TaxID=64144 RepID=A0A3Q1HUP4_ANATE|nr:CD209 antigen-like protein C [Anabas testudineus]